MRCSACQGADCSAESTRGGLAVNEKGTIGHLIMHIQKAFMAYTLSQHGESALFHNKDTKGQLWPLQTSLLVYYLDAFSENSLAEGRSIQTLSQVMTVGFPDI